MCYLLEVIAYMSLLRQENYFYTVLDLNIKPEGGELLGWKSFLYNFDLLLEWSSVLPMFRIFSIYKIGSDFKFSANNSQRK